MMNKYELIYDLEEHLQMCPNEEYYLSYNQVEMIVNFFKQLQQENKQLKEQFKQRDEVIEGMVKMETSESIKNLSREQLEKFTLNLLHHDHIQTHRANDLEDKIKKLEKYCDDSLQKLLNPFVFMPPGNIILELKKEIQKILEVTDA